MAQQGKKKKGGAAKVILAVLLVVILTAGGMALFAYREINGNGLKSGTEVTVSIPQGSGVAAIANRLKDAGVIRYPHLFRWYVGRQGAAAKLQYGEFELAPGSSYDAIIAALSAYAQADSVRLTFPEGTTAIAIARKMEDAGLCSAEDFLAEANTGDFSSYRFWQYVPDDKDAPDRFLKCEGYLFPDTYDFLKDDTVHHYVETFYAHFDKQITDEMYAAMEEQGMTLPEVVTLASFVQEEAGNAQDDNVAQVFRNRLALPQAPEQHLQLRPERRRQQLSLELGRALLRQLGQHPGEHPDGLRHLHLHRPACRTHLQPRHRGPPRRPRPPARRGGRGRLFLRHRPQGKLLLRPHLRRPSEKLRCGGGSK